MNFLLTLKRILNNIPDLELEDMTLWIDAKNTADKIVIEENAITILTDEAELKINGSDW